MRINTEKGCEAGNYLETTRSGPETMSEQGITEEECEPERDEESVVWHDGCSGERGVSHARRLKPRGDC